MAQFHTVESLGAIRKLTKEGFLIAENVPVSRTGVLLYAPGELPIPPGPDGLIRVSRSDDEVFAPSALASFEGKSLVDLHPGVDVTPENWRLFAVGHVQNVRRGTGDDADKMVADIVVKDAAAIKAVRAGKRNLSAGYDASYEITSPGYANQRNIIGNHVALVPAGRCGPECSIGDSEMTVLANLRDRLRTAYASKADKDFIEAVADVPEIAPATAGGTVLHIHTGDRSEGSPSGSESKETTVDKEFMNKTTDALTLMSETVKGLGEKFAKVETDLKDLVTKEEAREAKAADAEKATRAHLDAEKARLLQESDDAIEAKKTTKTGDSAALATTFQDAVARAEMLLPGVRVPTFDATAAPDTTTQGLCAFKRSVLTSALLVQGKAADHVQTVAPQNPDFSGMTCDQISSIFQGASELAKVSNNAGSRPGFLQAPTTSGYKGPPTAAEMNVRNREYYKRA